jgi:uncharacterized membrane protein (DUF106 family)
MLPKVLKISLFIGIFISSLTIVLARILPPSRIVVIIMLYMIVLSSVVSGIAIYGEIYLKPLRQMRRIEKNIIEMKKIKDEMKKKMETWSVARYSKHQTYLLLEESLCKLEEKIEKIEKEITDKSRC